MRTSQRDHQYLLDPQLLSRIGSLEVVARKIVEGTMVGMHESRSHGVGSEFAQYRPYIPGDDLRALDWRVFARTDRYYVRQYTAETNMHAWLIVDTSASMRFTSTGVSKLDIARMLAAAIAHLLIRQGDRVGLRPVAGDVSRTTLAAGGGERHLHLLMHALAQFEPSGEGSVVVALEESLERIRRRGPLFVFSDLYEPADRLGETVARFARAGFDVALFHVLDPMERDLTLAGDVEFIGLEGDGRLTADPLRIRKQYLEHIGEHLASLRRECRKAGADFIEIDTAQPLDEALSRYLRARRARIART